MDMVSNCTAPGGVGSNTSSGKKLHERMLAVCQQCRLWLSDINYCKVHMVTSLPLFESFGLSFARTGQNGDLIAHASRKNFCSNCRESPQWLQSKWPLDKPFLAKIPILDTEPSAHVQDFAGTISKTKLKSGGHGFNLHGLPGVSYLPSGRRA